MSSYYQIFLRIPEVGEPELAAIEAAAECQLGSVGGGGDGIAFAGRSGSNKVQVEAPHDFDDDYGIAFSQYPVVVTVVNLQHNKEQEEACARGIFRKLVEDEMFSMMLVFDLSVLIDRFDLDPK
ncbi:hypothetical protein GCM10010187_47490 [Actinomadura coerulea]|uniref:hypothetical protein n=1 Tax=Actinomadura coerulea TaxID=46159 RepID=UPI001617D832|nr:hypothetical protein [Actinomadura coerulea]GGQ25441.1 hypothetical protein GCM10010187_47490 [Actinomadura coerulea]